MRDIVDKYKILIAGFAFLAGGAALFLFIITIIFEIDLAKWLKCSAPFAAPEDKKSETCRRSKTTESVFGRSDRLMNFSFKAYDQ